MAAGGKPQAQLQACPCAPDATTLERVVLPSRTDGGQPAPALRFGDPRVQALLSALCAFPHLLESITNRNLRTLVTGLLPAYTARQATYDLRRLVRNGSLVRITGSQFAELDPALPADVAARRPLARAWRAYEAALDQRIANAALTA